MAGPRPGTPSRPDLRAGSIVAGRCRLVRRLGQGGMGEVWLAEHVALKTHVAVKFLHEDAAEEASVLAHDRFLFEARVSAKLANETPHIVRVHDAGRDEAGPYMIMEYVEGRSMESVLADDGPFTAAALAEIVDQLASALSIAHRRGIIHRD